MSNKEAVFPHFSQEEHPFVERALDWIDQVIHRQRSYLTSFLDPRQQQIVKMLVQRESDLSLEAEGGYPEAERRRLLLLPLFQTAEEGDFQLVFLRLYYPMQSRVEHRDILGSLMGLGIKRELFGDILIQKNSNRTDLIVAAEIADYVFLHLSHVGRTKVRMERLQREEVIIPPRSFETWKVSVASLRVDTMVAEGFRLSRSKAVQLIRNKRCQVNWRPIDNPATPIHVEDVISLRGAGRIYVLGIEGVSRKNRIQVQLGKIKD